MERKIIRIFEIARKINLCIFLTLKRAQQDSNLQTFGFVAQKTVLIP